MKDKITVDGLPRDLDSLEGSAIALGNGRYSVLVGTRSFDVVVTGESGEYTAAVNGRVHQIGISDPRDRAHGASQAGANGPAQVRSLMPGKIVKVLVQEGESVEAGQALLIVEAMKMQNDLKSPRAGSVQELRAVEGSTVGAGETLVVVA